MATSWFLDPELKPTTYTASYVCNNLSKYGKTLVYASVDDVVYVDTALTPYQTHKLPFLDKCMVHQVCFCTLNNLVVIVVASDNGILIYDSMSEEILSEMAAMDLAGLIVWCPDGSLYCQGICSVHMKKPHLVVGTSVGKLIVTRHEKEAKAGEGSSFEACETLAGHDEAFCCVESSSDGTLVASSDMSGLILIRNFGKCFKVICRIVGTGYPATSITFMTENWFLAEFLTGCLRLYHPESFHVHAEIAGHTRAITALDALNEFAVSVSEDTFVNIWDISSKKRGAGPRVKLVSSQAVPNDLLTGVAFASINSLWTIVYDGSHLKLWRPE